MITRYMILHIIYNIHVIVTTLDAADKFSLLSICEVHSDFEMVALADDGALVNGVALNNLYYIVYHNSVMDHAKVWCGVVLI